MIVLWGLVEDPPMAAVAQELMATRHKVAIVDQAFADQMKLTGDGCRQTILLGDTELRLAEIEAMYIRRYDARQIPGLDLEGQSGVDAGRVEAALMRVAVSADGVVLNRPGGEHLNNSKPAQLGLIQRHAPEFSVPETLVTTSPGDLANFVEAHEQCIVKSVSGHRSRVRVLRREELDDDRLGSVEFCPVQVQRWIAGTDVRVHVVGERTFATEIVSDADDYRYERAQLREITLPESIEDACVSLARHMRLGIAGVDLRRSDDGEWFCFEVNPSPAFTYYERATGQPIARAVAEELAR